MGRAHLLVVDDDERLRKLISRFLTEKELRVTTASSAEDARARMAGIEFDLLILDVMMPKEDGFEFATWVRKRSQIPILMLTAMDTVDKRIIGLEHGADDYLAKPFEPRELLLRVQSILRRTLQTAPRHSTVTFGQFHFDIGRHELRRRGERIHLTSAEAAMLSIFARNPGIAMSRDQLRSQSGASDRATDVHVARLRRKIESDPRMPRHLITVWGEGYMLRAD
tara:strand:- start:6295 stop:6966 length:672 start_codon:yes stop_codon:yes gene_type:complete